jgi:hypothetical protein
MKQNLALKNKKVKAVLVIDNKTKKTLDFHCA